MQVTRWHYHDPALVGQALAPGEEWKRDWTVPLNPREMGSLFPEKEVSIRQTSAVTGRALLFEGSAPPVNWTFSGAILNYEHHDRLLAWSRKRNRIIITDHFGRNIVCYLTKFEPTPKRSVGKYWRHEYTMTALVLDQPSVPTVGV